MTNLYETDLAEWAWRNAELLRSGQIAEADLENIAEEIESLGRNQFHELESRLTQIMEHLLKLKLTTGSLREQNQRGWQGSIERQRGEIERLLEISPSLKSRLTPEVLTKCYSAARRAFRASFQIQPPAECPFRLEEILESEEPA